MKKVLLLLLLSISLTEAQAFMPAHINHFTIGRIDQVEENNESIYINFDNFIYYKIDDYFRIFEERSSFIKEMTEISDTPNGMLLQEGDIVAIDSVWSEMSTGILKISCSNNVMKIEGTKNKYFGTGKGAEHSQDDVSRGLNDDLLLEKVNEVIGCENLDTFFDKDRRFQDLEGTNLLPYIYGITLFIASIFFGMIYFLLRKKKSKIA